jgi:hypothetical protein
MRARQVTSFLVFLKTRTEVYQQTAAYEAASDTQGVDHD